MNFPVRTEEARAAATAQFPRGRVVFQSFPGSPARDYFVYVPHRAEAGAPVVALVHGITRNAAEHIFRFSREAERAGAILIAPLFAKEAYGQYQQVTDHHSGIRADVALLDILDAVADETGASAERVYLFGFSGGAQFAHRFMMLHPDRVAAVAIAAAGWYTTPDTSLAYPYGIGSHPCPDARFYPDRFLSVPRHVFVGDQDIARDEALRTSRTLDQLQGETRLARARHWFAAMQRESQKRGAVPPRSSLTILAGAGHSFTEAAERHDLAEAVFRRFDLLSTNRKKDA